MKNKKDNYWEPRNEVFKDKDRAKSYTTTSTNPPRTQTPKKDKYGR